MDNNYCYHSPWCEPGERCGCEAYAKFEAEEKTNREIDAASDQVIKTAFCWIIAILFGLMVLKELVMV